MRRVGDVCEEMKASQLTQVSEELTQEESSNYVNMNVIANSSDLPPMQAKVGLPR